MSFPKIRSLRWHNEQQRKWVRKLALDWAAFVDEADGYWGGHRPFWAFVLQATNQFPDKFDLLLVDEASSILEEAINYRIGEITYSEPSPDKDELFFFLKMAETKRRLN